MTLQQQYCKAGWDLAIREVLKIFNNNSSYERADSIEHEIKDLKLKDVLETVELKCARAQCHSPNDGLKHRDLGTLYCKSCAAKINKYAGVELIK